MPRMDDVFICFNLKYESRVINVQLENFGKMS